MPLLEQCMFRSTGSRPQSRDFVGKTDQVCPTSGDRGHFLGQRCPADSLRRARFLLRWVLAQILFTLARLH